MRAPAPGSASEDKKTLRAQVRLALKSMNETQRATASAQARALLVAQPLWQNAGSVLLFAPMPEELDIWPLAGLGLETGKHLALPQFVPETGTYIACRVASLESSLATGRFGIREPVVSGDQIPLKRLDLIFVPGLAFDLQGRRLGRGKGFYDQLLGTLLGTTCGVGFDEQIVPAIPLEPHDVSVNCILTPTRWIEL